MRMAGATYAEIGEWLGVGPARAYQVVRAKDRAIGRAAFWLQGIAHGAEPVEWNLRRQEEDQVSGTWDLHVR